MPAESTRSRCEEGSLTLLSPRAASASHADYFGERKPVWRPGMLVRIKSRMYLHAKIIKQGTLAAGEECHFRRPAASR